MKHFLFAGFSFLNARKKQRTDFHHVNLQGVRGDIPKGVQGHHCQAVVDPDGCVALIEETGVVAC